MFNDKDQSYRYKDNPKPDLSLIPVSVSTALLSENYDTLPVSEPSPLHNYDVYSSKRLNSSWSTCLDNEIKAVTKNDQYRTLLHDIFMHVYSNPAVPQIEYSFMRSANEYIAKFFKNSKSHTNKDIEQIEELVRQVFPKLFIETARI